MRTATLSATNCPGACRSAKTRKLLSPKSVREAAGDFVPQSIHRQLSRSRKPAFDSGPGRTTSLPNPGLSFEPTRSPKPGASRTHPIRSTNPAERWVGLEGLDQSIVRERFCFPLRWQPSFPVTPENPDRMSGTRQRPPGTPGTVDSSTRWSC